MVKVSICRYRAVAENKTTTQEKNINNTKKQAGWRFLGGFSDFLVNNLLSTFFLLSTTPTLSLVYVKLPDKMDQRQTLTTAIQSVNNAGFHCFISSSNLEISLPETTPITSKAFTTFFILQAKYDSKHKEILIKVFCFYSAWT